MNLVKLQEELLGQLTTVLGHEIGLDGELLVEGGLDSFGIMQMVTYLEESYGMVVPDENLATVNFTSARIISEWVLPFTGQSDH
jgi:acyl carrier protein